MPDIKVIAGLGNPGREYANTRHNLGFRTVDILARQWGSTWKNWSGIAETASPENGVILIKPQQYMNRSGLAVSEFLRYRHFDPSELLVIYDDFSLPLGVLRVRLNGSAGGHNGLASIIEHLGASNFPRLRLGIGPVPQGVNPADFVLSEFPGSERHEVESMVKKAAETVEIMVTQGFDKAASKLSQDKPKQVN